MDLWRRLGQSVWSTTNNFATIAGLVLVLIGFYVVPATEKFSAAWSLTIGTFLVWLIIVIGRTALDVLRDLEETRIKLQAAEAALGSPKVVQGFASSRYYPESKSTLLVEPTWYLSVDSLVAVYQLEGSVEQMVAIGTVANIQADQRVQIVLLNDSHNGSHLDEIARNDQNVLNKLIIKPSVPKRIYGIDQNG